MAPKKRREVYNDPTEDAASEEEANDSNEPDAEQRQKYDALLDAAGLNDEDNEDREDSPKRTPKVTSKAKFGPEKKSKKKPKDAEDDPVPARASTSKVTLDQGQPTMKSKKSKAAGDDTSRGPKKSKSKDSSIDSEEGPESSLIPKGTKAAKVKIKLDDRKLARDDSDEDIRRKRREGDAQSKIGDTEDEDTQAAGKIQAWRDEAVSAVSEGDFAAVIENPEDVKAQEALRKTLLKKFLNGNAVESFNELNKEIKRIVKPFVSTPGSTKRLPGYERVETDRKELVNLRDELLDPGLPTVDYYLGD